MSDLSDIMKYGGSVTISPPSREEPLPVVESDIDINSPETSWEDKTGPVEVDQVVGDPFQSLSDENYERLQ